MNQTDDNQYTQILDFLNSQPGKLQAFLYLIPMRELRNAIQEKQLLQDLAFHQQRNTGQNIFKQNVLDYTMEEIIKTSYREKLLNYFEYKLALENFRLQTHPCYGLRLVSRYPQKYYVGDKSSHYNHAKEIQELYEVRKKTQSSENQSGLQQKQEKNQEQQDFIHNNDEQKNNENQQQEESQTPIENEEEFIVDDSAVEQSNYDIIDDLQAKIKQNKRKKKQQKKAKKQSPYQSNRKKNKLIQKLGKGRKLRKINSDHGSPSQSDYQSQQNEQSQSNDSLFLERIQNEYLIPDPQMSKRNSQDIMNDKLNKIIFGQQSIKKKALPKMLIQSQED